MFKMKQGLILLNAYGSVTAMEYVANRLKNEFENLGVNIGILANNFFAAKIQEDGSIGLNLPKEYDFCVYLNKDKYISQMLESQGLKLFNSHNSIQICDDKVLTFITLSKHNIPMPTTLPGLLCFSPLSKIEEKTYLHIERSLGYPLIVKSSYGSFGSGVYKIDNREQLVEIMEKLKTRPHLFQRFVESSSGKDIRVTVIGGKVVSAIVRKSETDFRSNLELGGTASKITPDRKLICLCEKVAKLLKLDYCGIDVLFGQNGNYLICEVNSNAIFKGSESASGVNIAGLYAKHIFTKVYKEKIKN